MADDQVEPDKKNDVTIQPAEKLEAGNYVLTAKAGIESKSGVVMEKDYTLNFMVPGEKGSVNYGLIGAVILVIAAAAFFAVKKRKK